MDTSKLYLISGGSGFLGADLIARLAKEGVRNIRVVARNEGLLVALKERFPYIEIMTGNINDPFVCEKACAGVSGIFHLAAFKHVGLAEQNVRECTLSNVYGTMNLLEETRKTKPEFIIGISTDKAARVSGVYGATKLLMERLFTEYERINPDTQYRIVRYGNVLYSTGSVLCKWKDRILADEEVIVTSMMATRFFWTVDEAVDLIFNCLDNATDAKPYTAKMKAIQIQDLLDAMYDKYSTTGNRKIKIIGMQPGENLHEIIDDSGTTSETAERYTKEEILTLI